METIAQDNHIIINRNFWINNSVFALIVLDVLSNFSNWKGLIATDLQLPPPVVAYATTLLAFILFLGLFSKESERKLCVQIQVIGLTLVALFCMARTSLKIPYPDELTSMPGLGNWWLGAIILSAVIFYNLLGLFKTRSNFKPTAVFGINIVSLIFLGSAAFSIGHRKPISDGGRVARLSNLKIPAQNLNLILKPSVKGPKGTLILFGDFQCPYTQDLLPRLNSKPFSRINVVWSNFPLEMIHSNADAAAEVSEVLAIRHRFTQDQSMIPIILQTSPVFTPSFVLKQLKLGPETPLEHSYAIRTILQEFDFGRKVSVKSTPSALLSYNGKTYFLEGLSEIRHCPDWVDPDLAQPSSE